MCDLKVNFEQLGWATAPESGFVAIYQCGMTDKLRYGPPCYLRGPSGEVYRIYQQSYLGGGYNQWERLN